MLEPETVFSDIQATKTQISNNEESTKSILTYGSQVYLSYKEGQIEYIAFAEGLSNSRISLKMREQFDKDNSNVNGLFRLYPSFFHSEYNRGKNKFHEIISISEVNELEKRKTRTSVPKVIKELQEELQLNLDVYEKIKGLPIKFGETVQLFHVNSQKYIRYHVNKTSDLENDCLKVDLGFETSDATCFKVVPSYKFQQESEGNLIYDEDTVFLIPVIDMSNKIIGQPHLHASRSISALDEENPTQKGIEKKEINVSSTVKTRWKLKIFTDYLAEKKDVLATGDIIWISMSQFEKNLIAYYDYQTDDFDFKFQDISSSNKNSKTLGNSNGMFVIENPDMKKGNLVSWNSPYYLRHLSTNKYLTMILYESPQTDEEKEPTQYILKLADQKSEAIPFSFQMVYSTISTKKQQLYLQFVSKDAFFMLLANDKYWLTCREIKAELLDLRFQKMHGEILFQPLFSDENENSVMHLSRVESIDMTMTLFLVSCKRILQNSVKYLESQFINFHDRDIGQLQLKNRVFSFKMEQVIESMTQLNLFCCNKLLEFLSPDQSYGTRNNSVQNVLREQHFIELLAKLLIKAFPTYDSLKQLVQLEKARIQRKDRKRKEDSFGSIFSEEENTIHLEDSMQIYDTQQIQILNSQHRAQTMKQLEQFDNDLIDEIQEEIAHKKKQLVEIIYQLIISVCEKNTLNQQYAAKFLPLFQMQTDFFKGAIDCVYAVIEQNEDFLLKVHSSFQVQEHSELEIEEKLSMKVSPMTGRSPQTRRMRQNTIRIGKIGSFSAFTQQMALNLSDGYDDAFKNFYNKIQDNIDTNVSKVFHEWSYLQFYAALLSRTKGMRMRRKLIQFFRMISAHNQEALPMNQETIFKLFVDNDDSECIMNSNMIKIFERNSNLFVDTSAFDHLSANEYRLIDLIQSTEGQDSHVDYENLHYESYNDDSNYIREEEVDLNPNQQLVITHLNFLSNMCQNRNYIWKGYLEKQISWDALLRELQQELPNSIKAALSRLIINLYLDQEPRREKNLPILCKIVDRKRLKSLESEEGLKSVGSPLFEHKDLIVVENFKYEVFQHILGLQQWFEKLPLQFKEEQFMDYQATLFSTWPQLYNEYSLELIAILMKLLKFKKIKISAKKLKVEKIVEESSFQKKFNKLKDTLKINKLQKGLISAFKKKKQVSSEQDEYGKLLKQVLKFLEYDRTYPECKKVLDVMRKDAEEKLKGQNIFKATKGLVKGLLSQAKNVFWINFSENESKQQKKDKMHLNFLEKDITGQKIYLRQTQALIKILDSMISYSEATIETQIKLRVLDIVDHFFQFKQDKLLANARRIFIQMVEDNDLITFFHQNKIYTDKLKEKLAELVPHYLKYFFPKVMSTGTSIDTTDPIYEEENNVHDIIDLSEILGYELFPVLLQQFAISNNKEYEAKLLSTALVMYNQRETFIANTQKLLLLFDDVNIKNYKRSLKLYDKLQKYTEESEKWLTPLMIDERIIEETKDIILYFYNSLFSILPGSEERDFDRKRCQKESPNPLRQEMHRFLQIYIPIIHIIKGNMTVIEHNQSDHLVELFQMCFSYLTVYVKDSESNQYVLSGSLSIFLQNLHLNLGQVQLINEIFRDNCSIVSHMTHDVVEPMIELIAKCGRRAEYLEFFKIIQKCKEDMIYENQKLVLDVFLDARNKNKLCFFQNKNQFSFQKSSGMNKLKNIIDEPYIYHAALLEVLSMAAVGKEGLINNEVRLRQTIEFEYLLDLLLNEDCFTDADEILTASPSNNQKKDPEKVTLAISLFSLDTQQSGEQQDQIDEELDPEIIKNQTKLKIPAAEYIFYVYVESDKRTDDFQDVRNKMTRLVVKEKNRIEEMKQCTDQYINYLFDYLCIIITWYYKTLANDEKTIKKGGLEKDTLNSVKEFGETLKKNMGKFNSSKISMEGKRAAQDLWDSLGIENKTQFTQSKTVLVQKKRKNVALMDSEQPGQQEGNNQSESEVLHLLWKEFVEVLQESKEAQKEIDKEQKIFAKAIMKTSEFSGKEKSLKELINHDQIVKQLVIYVKENQITDENAKTFLLVVQALTNIIENTVDEEGKIKSQNFLNKNNCVFMLMNKLSDPSLKIQDPLFHKLIKFGIQFLDGGNNNVQKNIYKYVTSFPDSENFFKKIHIGFNNEIQMLKNLNESADKNILEDNSQLMEDILRFLQLFAEGHYQELQNYTRQQTNSYHSYDLLIDITNLLGVYIKTKLVAYQNTMLQCLDTLTEFIQGPCVQNQLAILQGSFLDIAAELYAIDEKASKLLMANDLMINHSNELEKWHIARLKYKCSITVLSLLEARQDDKNTFRVMKAIPIEDIRRNLVDLYEMFVDQYKGEYTNELFNHFLHDPDEKHSKEYCSLIIETGFNLFFLLNMFMEIKAYEDEFQEGDEHEDQSKKSFLADNIVIGWFRFIKQVFKVAISYCKKLGKGVRASTQKLTSGISPKRSSRRKSELDIIRMLESSRSKHWRDTYQFFKNNTANIEVLREDGNLERVYFFKLPFCHAITKDTKNKFQRQVNRISAKSKVSYLLKKAGDLIYAIKHEYRLKQLFNKLLLLDVLIANIKLWRESAYYSAIIINALILAGFQYNDQDEIYIKSDSIGRGIEVIGSMMIGFSFIIVSYFLLKTAPFLIQKAWVGVSKDKLNIFAYLFRLLKTIKNLFTDFYVLYYTIYGFAAFMGIFISNFFFAFHLFEAVVRYPLLQTILRSVYDPGKSLILTYMFLQLFNYFFALFAYYFFPEDYEGLCSSVWKCYLTVFDKAFKADGGIGGFLGGSETEIDILRFAYDNIYNIFIMIMILNIVMGIILDTFENLRESEKKFSYDINNICFVCGFDRETLDKATDARNGFLTHIKSDHYMWNYLFYIAYINQKEQTEYTGIESYIAEQIKNDDISWFPTHRAMIMKGTKLGSHDEVADMYQEIQGKQNELFKFGKKMSKNIDNLEELVKGYRRRKKAYLQRKSFRSAKSSSQQSQQFSPY